MYFIWIIFFPHRLQIFVRSIVKNGWKVTFALQFMITSISENTHFSRVRDISWQSQKCRPKMLLIHTPKVLSIETQLLQTYPAARVFLSDRQDIRQKYQTLQKKSEPIYFVCVFFKEYSRFNAHTRMVYTPTIMRIKYSRDRLRKNFTIGNVAT